MASTFMISDSMKMDKINPTTFTGDFGINHNGFAKKYMDGSYDTQIDESETIYTDELNINVRGNSGNMYLKTGYPHPAPSLMFPARKYEYSNGNITWERQGAPWRFDNGLLDSIKREAEKAKDNTLVILGSIALVIFILSRIK